MTGLQDWKPTREAVESVSASVRRDYPQSDERTREEIRQEALRWLHFWQREWNIAEREARREAFRASR